MGLLAEREAVWISPSVCSCVQTHREISTGRFQQGDFNGYLEGEGVPKGPSPPTELMSYLKEPAARVYFQSFEAEKEKLAVLSSGWRWRTQKAQQQHINGR
jgi:hypothetical protein